MIKIISIMLFILIFINLDVKAFDLQEWFEDEAMRLYLAKEKNHRGLGPHNRVTSEEIHDRVYYRFYYAEKLNYIYPGIHPRRVVKDIFILTSYESYWVNWRCLDGGKSFGTASMRWSTAQWLAEYVYGWDWEEDQNKIASSARLQAKYMVGYYYWLLKHYEGDRHLAMTGYNKGHGVRPGEQWKSQYFERIYTRLVYYEEQWKLASSLKVGGDCYSWQGTDGSNYTGKYRTAICTKVSLRLNAM